MLTIMPKHKGTDKLRADLRKRMEINALDRALPRVDRQLAHSPPAGVLR